MAKLARNGSPSSFYIKNGNVLAKAVLDMSESITVDLTEKWVSNEDML